MWIWVGKNIHSIAPQLIIITSIFALTHSISLGKMISIIPRYSSERKYILIPKIMNQKLSTWRLFLVFWIYVNMSQHINVREASQEQCFLLTCMHWAIGGTILHINVRSSVNIWLFAMQLCLSFLSKWRLLCPWKSLLLFQWAISTYLFTNSFPVVHLVGLVDWP